YHKQHEIMKNILLFIVFIIPFLGFAQSNEKEYSVKGIVTNNSITRNKPIIWGQIKKPAPSEIFFRHKSDGSYYIKMTANGKFGYGGYFKYIGKEGSDFKYKRTDSNTDDIILINFSIIDITKSNKYENQIVMKMITYQSSYGLMLTF
ncbi:MAG: hypothetical protein PHC38_01930, partial [Weeksellaceae bacterium]|nr:hypothetical protein [Weeksellaceae bacterium]